MNRGMDAIRRLCYARTETRGGTDPGAKSGLGRPRDMSEILIKRYVGDICNATVLNVYCFVVLMRAILRKVVKSLLFKYSE